MLDFNVHAGRHRYFCGSCRLPLDREKDGCMCCDNTKGCINETENQKVPIMNSIKYVCTFCKVPFSLSEIDGETYYSCAGCNNIFHVEDFKKLCPACNFPLKKTASGWLSCLKCKSDFPNTPANEDLVNTPSHYQGKGGLQVRDVIIAFGLDKDFDLANVIKYVLRCNRKGNKRQDLQKAIKYLTWSLDNCQVNSDTD